MNALKCDRCNNYYDYDPNDAILNYISFDNFQGLKDHLPLLRLSKFYQQTYFT